MVMRLTKHSQRKRIGTLAENDLLKQFWKAGFAAMRSAGSGSMRYPGPDLLVGNGGRVLAIECKKTKDKAKYVPREDIEGLKEFSRMFGAEPYLAVQFGDDDWLLLAIEDLDKTEKSYSTNRETASLKGITVQEFVDFENK